MRVIYFANNRQETITVLNNKSQIGKSKTHVTQVFMLDHGDEFEIRGDRDDLMDLFLNAVKLLQITRGPV